HQIVRARKKEELASANADALLRDYIAQTKNDRPLPRKPMEVPAGRVIATASPDTQVAVLAAAARWYTKFMKRPTAAISADGVVELLRLLLRRKLSYTDDTLCQIAEDLTNRGNLWVREQPHLDGVVRIIEQYVPQHGISARLASVLDRMKVD